MKSKKASNLRNLICSQKVVKKNTTIEIMHNDALDQVRGCLKVDICEKVKDEE